MIKNSVEICKFIYGKIADPHAQTTWAVERALVDIRGIDKRA
jgi:hypothetical protein